MGVIIVTHGADLENPEGNISFAPGSSVEAAVQRWRDAWIPVPEGGFDVYEFTLAKRVKLLDGKIVEVPQPIVVG